MDTSTIVEHTDQDIAIISMAGRFPNARDIDAFWRNLRDGVVSISLFSDQELADAGVAPELIAHPLYIKAGYILEDAEQFDAAFFGFTPREAEIIDPQQRIFLECAWEALEIAGYNPETYEGLIGVYAGTNMTTYFLFNLLSNQELLEEQGFTQTRFANDKDYLSTRVSYKLNLRGPSLTIQTACSTSLVAVHIACQALLNGECDMALAGGVSVMYPQKEGYLYHEGGILSPDGRCRAFDSEGQGTVFGSGVGIVVLKRLADALVDGDTICAVIKGSAINNDGSLKVGYTAPSEIGQAEVITEALALARVSPETISYVETHGTATPLGDPIEIAALTQAFRADTERNQFCAIGSVKTNIGHLDAAAGAAGLIKTVLALQHGMLPPNTNYTAPNPKIDFANSPFYVNTTLVKWPEGTAPRRAGVSSFGIGGTNAHVVIEEAPALPASSESRPWQLLLLSAKTDAALERMTTQFAEHFRQHSDLNLADAAYTSQVGRQPFAYRRALVCQNLTGAAEALEKRDSQCVFTGFYDGQDRRVVFMFPGGGAQYVNMGLDLYQTEPVFHQEIDRCLDLLTLRQRLDLRPVLYPSEGQAEDAAVRIRRTSMALPALFVVEYALSQLWMSWGIRPHAMIGHSLGEYVAACLAGVIALEDALALVSLRGQLFEQIEQGAMISVALPSVELLPLLGSDLSLAAINGPSLCVVSGSIASIDRLAATLAEREIETRLLQIDVAGHSALVTPILEPFTRFVARLPLQAPAIPYISNISGTWITEAETTDPHYWAKHLRQTVRFNDGIEELSKQPNVVFLEVGPGRGLSSLVNLHATKERGWAAIPSLRHPQTSISDVAFLQQTLGKLWLTGVEQIDWMSFYSEQRRRRIALPTYPFERQRYWIEPQRNLAGSLPRRRGMLRKKPEIADWFYAPIWKQSLPHALDEAEVLANQKQRWLVFADTCGIGAQIAERLKHAGQDVITVVTGEHFAVLSDESYTLDPRKRDDYAALISALRVQDRNPTRIVHLWSLTPHDDSVPIKQEHFECAQTLGFDSILYLTHALSAQHRIDATHITLVSNNIQNVTGSETVRPEKATALGLCKVIPQEYPHIACRNIDIVLNERNPLQSRRLLDRLMRELVAPLIQSDVAYRGVDRWVQTFEAIPRTGQCAAQPRLREEGVYLIVGGLAGTGLMLAEHLARTARAKLALVERSALPARIEWDHWLADQSNQGELIEKLRAVRRLEELGAQVRVITADITDSDQFQQAFNEVEGDFGTLHGVIFAEGNTGAELFHGISELDYKRADWRTHSRLHGLYALENVLGVRELDFCVIFSSLSAVLGGLGHVIDAAMSHFTDLFVQRHNQTGPSLWISVNWDAWVLEEDESLSGMPTTGISDLAMTPKEIGMAFERAIVTDVATQLVISTGDLETRIDQWINRKPVQKAMPEREDVALHPRPNFRSNYVAPGNDIEWVLTDIWQKLLGIEQVSVQDSFFDLGGHSLLATQLISRIGNTFKIDLPIRKLFEEPTVAALASHIVGCETKPGQTQKLAQVLRRVKSASAEEMHKTLEQKRKERGIA